MILYQFCIDQAIFTQYSQGIDGMINSIDIDESSCVVVAVHLEK